MREADREDVIERESQLGIVVSEQAGGNGAVDISAWNLYLLAPSHH